MSSENIASPQTATELGERQDSDRIVHDRLFSEVDAIRSVLERIE